MSRDFEQRLDDIIESCNRVADYISGYDLAKFEDDYKTQDAVIRQFEIIGEAVKHLPEDVTLQEPAIPWRQFAGFRDVLAHSYFAVDVSVVWEATKDFAPVFVGSAKVCAPDGAFPSCRPLFPDD
jgi:uncharacterized protein with HEPN domain